MRHTIGLITLSALVMAAPGLAAASKAENVGVGTGATVGAIAAGPVGMIVGAAIGAKLGDTIYRKNGQINELTVSLGESEQRVGRLHTNIDTMTAELERLQQLARPELVGLLQSGIAMDLLFRTDEHVLTDSTGTRLGELARVLAGMPEIRIQLGGFADERGDESYNLELSRKRVDFVREQLIAAGIGPERISANAYGENPALDATPDSFALERRVSMRLFIGESQAFAAQ